MLQLPTGEKNVITEWDIHALLLHMLSIYLLGSPKITIALWLLWGPCSVVPTYIVSIPSLLGDIFDGRLLSIWDWQFEFNVYKKADKF